MDLTRVFEGWEFDANCGTCAAHSEPDTLEAALRWIDEHRETCERPACHIVLTPGWAIANEP